MMRRDRGAALLWALMLLVVSALLLGALAVRWSLSTRLARVREVREEALFEARGGARAGAAALARGATGEVLREADRFGVLTVRVDDGRIESVFRVLRPRLERRVRARWGDGAFHEWEEE